jgi:phage virion morphogenesis protein
MTKITINIDDAEVKATLKALAERGQDMRAVLQVVGTKMVERTQRRFDTSTGPDGVKWKENKPATRKAKGGKPPLVDHGYLRQQILASVSGNTLTVGTTAVTAAYAAIQQFGGTIDRAAGSIKVRHRTNAKGDLLRSEIMNGKGLIFARKNKNPHKRFTEREFSVAAHKITIPARPFLPMRSDGTLYPQEQADVLAALNEYLIG